METRGPPAACAPLRGLEASPASGVDSTIRKLPKTFEKIRARNPAVVAAYENLGKECAGAGPLDERTRELVKLGMASLASTRRLVVFAQGDVPALPEGVLQFSGPISVLRGGYDAWQAAVLAAPLPPESPTPALIAEFRLKSALHSRYTGAAAAQPPRIELRPPVPLASGPRKGGGC